MWPLVFSSVLKASSDSDSVTGLGVDEADSLPKPGRANRIVSISQCAPPRLRVSAVVATHTLISMDAIRDRTVGGPSPAGTAHAGSR